MNMSVNMEPNEMLEKNMLVSTQSSNILLSKLLV